MNKGLAMFAANRWYVMQTEKRRVTVPMITEFVREVIKARGLSQDVEAEILRDNRATAEVRKNIRPCSFEQMEMQIDFDGKTKPRIYLETYGKNGSIIVFGNFETEDVTIFTEKPKENLKVKRLLEEKTY